MIGNSKGYGGMRMEGDEEEIEELYSTGAMPEPDGHPTYHRPRRNFWGNLLDEDTFDEERSGDQGYDYSDFDAEDDHSSFYDCEGYD